MLLLLLLFLSSLPLLCCDCAVALHWGGEWGIPPPGVLQRSLRSCLLVLVLVLMLALVLSLALVLVLVLARVPVLVPVPLLVWGASAAVENGTGAGACL